MKTNDDIKAETTVRLNELHAKLTTIDRATQQQVSAVLFVTGIILLWIVLMI